MVSAYIPTAMPTLTSSDMARIFDKLDRNGDGLVSLEELNWLLDRTGLVPLGLEELHSLVGKPCLDFNDFMFFYSSISSSQGDGGGESEAVAAEEEERDLAKAFEVFDLNRDGFISCEELQSVLSRLGLWQENCGKDCRNMIRTYDTNSDGLLDFEEFKKMMLLAIS
ncbi:probable calcium-binding protein CML44 [Malania oleifera]|uniref:probable calcium-binding protein CML44 n=1 Tax=Malania oleifera TaxID=397392 RepID=UPI0025AEC3FA|nr:probable calcium-binding protein CML44 [Malania oleifera]